MSDQAIPGTAATTPADELATAEAVAAAQRAARVEEASEAIRDLMGALDKIAHEHNLSRSQWLADVKENLDILTERYSDWTGQFLDEFAEEPAWVDPTPWLCQSCGYRGATPESVTPTPEHHDEKAILDHAGVAVFDPRSTPPADETS
jgi:hypothetical protein